jgi:hypothetical protein
MTELLILAPLDAAPIRVDVAYGGYVGQERTHYAKVIWPAAISLSWFDGPPLDVFEVSEAMYELAAPPYQYDGPLSMIAYPPKPSGVGHDWLLHARFLPRFGVTTHSMFGPDQLTTVLVLAGHVPPSEDVRLLPLASVQELTNSHR